mmetsp:Transcript_28091/g.30693  ORF Transcript_28091/g.30693 Transcript_28091/m.30693 type:complete len:384 (+) Transcript_28091:69-1220(+)
MIIEEEIEGSPVTSTSTSSTSLNQQQNFHSEKMKDVEREGAIREFQNRLVLLHHAANCPFSNGTSPQPCRGFPSCFEMVQLLKHVNNCELRECAVPHCVSTRYLLTHSKTCVKEECIICRPLKESIKRKSERSRQVVTVVKRKREDGYMSMEEVSPLSTPRFESDVEEEDRRKKRIEAYSVHANTSGESESDTASQISSTLYQAFASDLAMEQSDDVLDSMNECLNISPQFIQQQNHHHHQAFQQNQTQRQHHQQPSPVLQQQVPRQTPIVPTLPLSSLTNSHSPPIAPLSSNSTSNSLPYSCYKCRTGIPMGYRYYCESCQINICMDCFHCADTPLPHEHPVRAIKVESIQQNVYQTTPPQPPTNQYHHQQQQQNRSIISQY